MAEERLHCDPSAERIRCKEVWGGNLRIEKCVQVPGLDVWLASQPLGEDEAGGDVYYVSSCAAGRLTRILLADVSGHGERVAQLAGRLRDLIRKNIEVADHGQLVADMNREFEADNPSGTFATAVVFSFFAPTRSLLVCNAGHPPPLAYRRSTGRWEYLDRLAGEVRSPKAQPAGLPLGMLPRTEYEQRKVRLQRGDAVLCCTDALIEAQRRDGSPLGPQGLLELVADGSPLTDGADLIARVIDSVQAMHPDNLHEDDSTLVLFRATGVRFHLRDQLMAPFRRFLFRGLDACRIATPQRRPRGGPAPGG
jgi:serine phosphatase RsbU (regulator of sigma subunit)